VCARKRLDTELGVGTVAWRWCAGLPKTDCWGGSFGHQKLTGDPLQLGDPNKKEKKFICLLPSRLIIKKKVKGGGQEIVGDDLLPRKGKACPGGMHGQTPFQQQKKSGKGEGTRTFRVPWGAGGANRENSELYLTAQVNQSVGSVGKKKGASKKREAEKLSKKDREFLRNNAGGDY